MAESISTARIRQLYGVPLFVSLDPLFGRCLWISGGLGLLVLALAYSVPKHEVEISNVEQVPARFAKLILQAPEALPPAPAFEPKSEPELVPEKKSEPKPLLAEAPKVTPPAPAGEVGREMAKTQVAAEIDEVRESLDRVLDDLSTALSSSENTVKKPQRRPKRRETRAGRSASQLAGSGIALPGLAVPLSESSVSGAQIAIESIRGSGGGLDPLAGGESPEDESSTVGARRSDDSLLSVVRRYAPGIQFCYDDQLEKLGELGGKLVFRITVGVSGRVTNVVLLEDTVGSPVLIECALTQIEAWRFPEVPEGIVTFRAPFIFTPPE